MSAGQVLAVAEAIVVVRGSLCRWQGQKPEARAVAADLLHKNTFPNVNADVLTQWVFNEARGGGKFCIGTIPAPVAAGADASPVAPATPSTPSVANAHQSGFLETVQRMSTPEFESISNTGAKCRSTN
jgi:hypothetical protein